MSTNPAVSVIVPFLNGESFLPEAIGSVFAQTCDSWELLLVDDGSNDGGTEIALRYAELNPDKVRYLEHNDHINRGISASRNLGLSHARGEFAAFLDADDVWLPGKLERQAAIMKQNPDVALIFNPSFIWKDGVKTPQRMPLKPGRLPRGAWLITLLGHDGTDAFPSAIMARKDVALKVGGFGGSNLFEDQTTWIKFSVNSTVYYDEECVALYRIHPASCCASVHPDQLLLEEIGFCKWVVSYLQQHNDVGRLPTIMARCNLVTALLQLMDRSNSKQSARFQKSCELIRGNIESLGYFFPVLLLLGAISSQAASSITEGIFVFSRITYSEGLRKSLRVIPRYFLQTIRCMIPQSIKRSIRHVFGVANGFKS